MNARLGRSLLLPLLMVATVGCDRVTKHFAAATLAGTPGRSFLADTVRLEYAQNAGGFLSLGADLPPAVRTAVFTVGTSCILLATLAFALRMRRTRWTMVGTGLLLAGGVSNLVDRIVHGSVIDFLNVGIGALRTGIFNVADVAVLAGSAVLVLAVHRSETDARRAEPPDAPNPGQIAPGP